jgi:hypothetical protein
MKAVHARGCWLAAAAALVAGAAQAQGAASAPSGTVYRCPGSPVLYTDALTAEQAKERDCRTVEGAPVTIIQSPKPRPAPAPAPAPATRGPDSRVDPSEQRARDSDARRILENELRREEERLAALRAQYNNGQPERLGNERNYQKYLDRVAEMKAGIARKEGDIEANKRELKKHPS